MFDRSGRAQRSRRGVVPATVLATVGAVAAGFLGVASGSPAGAATGTAGTAYSAVGKVSIGAGLGVHASGGGLLSPLNGLLSGVLSPLTSTVMALPSSLVTELTNDLIKVGMSATAVTTSVAAPASGYPTSCITGGWTNQTCYGPLVPDLGLSSLIGLNTELVQGFATGTASQWASRTSVAGPDLSVLGLDLGNLGVAQSSTSCQSAGACTASHSLVSMSLLNGLIKVQTASSDSGLLQVSLANAPFVALSSLSRSLTPLNSLVSVSANGNLLQVQVGISLDNLLGGLGLAGLLSGLSPLVSVNSTVALTLQVGPGSTVVANSSAESWGLGVNLDLSGDVTFSLLGGLVSTDVGIDSGLTSGGGGNLLNLQLAYSNATAGTAGATPGNGKWVPAGLI